MGRERGDRAHRLGAGRARRHNIDVRERGEQAAELRARAGLVGGDDHAEPTRAGLPTGGSVSTARVPRGARVVLTLPLVGRPA